MRNAAAQPPRCGSAGVADLGTLAGGIAHDFNNLLTAIMGFSQLAMAGFDPASRTYRNLDRVVQLGNQAAGLIKQLLTFSRKAPSEKRALSLSPIVKETVKMLERTLPETIAVTREIHRDIPDVNADATQMQQILMNLCVNARDAMPEGGQLSISLRNAALDTAQARCHGDRSPGPYVCLAVKDTGTGIPPEVREHIFEPFFTTKEAGKGTGLGLAIIHGIVESHGGHIHIETAPERGTEFQIYLPAIQGEAGQEATRLSETPRGTERLLLVEDDASVREIARKMLEGQGYRILTASDGEEGLAIYRSKGDEIDLVITDLVMPNLGGVAFCREVERIAPDAKTLLISGYDEQEAVNGALETLRPAGFLLKPFDLGALASAVRQALDGDATSA